MKPKIIIVQSSVAPKGKKLMEVYGIMTMEYETFVDEAPGLLDDMLQSKEHICITAKLSNSVPNLKVSINEDLYEVHMFLGLDIVDFDIIAKQLRLMPLETQKTANNIAKEILALRRGNHEEVPVRGNYNIDNLAAIIGTDVDAAQRALCSTNHMHSSAIESRQHLLNGAARLIELVECLDAIILQYDV